MEISELGWPHYVGLVVLGIFVGLFSGLFGVGGGIIIIPSLVLFMGMTQQTAQGLSVAFMVPVALANALTYYREGATNMTHLPILLAVVIGALPAGVFASWAANQISQATLRSMFAIFMVAVAVRIMPAATFRPTGAAALIGVLVIAVGIRLIMMRS
ncbi:MAG: TSUP family transporter [Armatimonadetes bacterium]|nr:TSUP family transporter [Armatimonadota bacterium]NIO75594.1 TSUP family transporter [Armatimonadota bacterium]NIO98648.1 TSUP family transporter [Armatimonadota bacterium]